MKVLILPYSFNNFLSKDKRASGVDECMLKQKSALDSLGHDVKIYLSYSDLKDCSVIKYDSELIDKDIINQNYKREFPKIVESLILYVKKFKPDVILSNYAFIGSFYKVLQEINIPIYHLSHTVPGSFPELVAAHFINEMLENGHSLGAVSKYQKVMIEKYYASKKKSIKRGNIISWGDIKYNIIVDHITPATYAIPCEIVESKTNTIRHISAASKAKKTFLIHEYTGESYHSDVFTTLNYVGSDSESIHYVNSNLEKYKDSGTSKTHIDIDHTDIMDRIKDSSAFFVGLAPFDSFTITSIEALQLGIPLILYGKNNYHPALEFVSDEFQKYTYVYSKKDDFLTKLEEFSLMTLDDRKSLAKNCVDQMSFENFKNFYESALKLTIEKYHSQRNYII